MNKADIRAELDRIKAEIHHYPRPIAGCDAQFNHLLEQRSALERALIHAGCPAQTEAGT